MLRPSCLRCVYTFTTNSKFAGQLQQSNWKHKCKNKFKISKWSQRPFWLHVSKMIPSYLHFCQLSNVYNAGSAWCYNSPKLKCWKFTLYTILWLERHAIKIYLENVLLQSLEVKMIYAACWSALQGCRRNPFSERTWARKTAGVLKHPCIFQY